jgi:hypothetical protein
LLALYKFRVFLARDNTYARMFADLFHADSLGWEFLWRCGLGKAHIPGFSSGFRLILAPS